MYESFYGFSDDPFRLTPDRRFCYPHKTFRKAKAYLEYGTQREEGFVMVTGAPGTGKTTLIEDALAELDSANLRVIRLNTTRLEGGELVRMIAYSLDLKADHLDKASLLRQIIRTLDGDHRQGRRALLIVDEAQGLSEDGLEELRFLTNLQDDGRPLLQIFLIGQDGLRDLVNRPGLEQLQQRMIAASHLRAMDADETRAYMEHRLAQVGWQGDPHFEPDLYPVICEVSGGIPRRVNQICARLLMYGFVEDQRHFGRKAMEAVLTDLVEEGLLTPQQGDARRLLHGYGGSVAPAEPRTEPAKAEPAVAPAPARPVAEPAAPRSSQPQKPVAPRAVARSNRLGVGLGLGLAAVVMVAVAAYFGRDLLGLQGVEGVRDFVSAIGNRLGAAVSAITGAEFSGAASVDDGSVASSPR